jgi:thiamine biosynthesis lipoprotein
VISLHPHWWIFGEALSASLGVLTRASQVTEHRFTVMGGPASLLIKHKQSEADSVAKIIDDTVTMLRKLESDYSRYRKQSVISLINSRAGTKTVTPVDTEARGLLQFCHSLHKESGGVFDPTVGILNRAWDFRHNALPDPSHVRELLKSVGWQHLELDESGARLGIDDAEIDLGGVVKEYAADKAAAWIQSRGIMAGVVNLAGDVATFGSKAEKAPWQIGISDPSLPEEPVMTIELSDACVATSGSNQRFIDIDGERHSHFLNPLSGKPVRGCFSVSVIASSCLLAGGVATVACLKGRSAATDWLNRSGLPWLMVESNRLSGPIAEQRATRQALR